MLQRHSLLTDVNWHLILVSFYPWRGYPGTQLKTSPTLARHLASGLKSSAGWTMAPSPYTPSLTYIDQCLAIKPETTQLIKAIEFSGFMNRSRTPRKRESDKLVLFLLQSTWSIVSSLDYFTGVIEHTEEMKGVEYATETQVKGLYRVGLKMEDSQFV